MLTFCTTYNLKCLVKESTCFKNVDRPSCFILIQSDKSLYFQNTSVIETGLSDLHKLTVTTMKSSFQKQEPVTLNYRNYKYCYNDNLRNDLLHEISEPTIP